MDAVTGDDNAAFAQGGAETAVGTEPLNDRAPTGARVHAQQQEEARVTLVRALRTTVHLLVARGYDVTGVGRAPVADAADALAKLAKYAAPRRAAMAERACEIVLVADTPAVKRPFTTVDALDLPPHRLAVFVVDKGQVGAMRIIQSAMQLCNFQIGIILSRKPLTSFSKKFIQTVAPGALAPIQHFTYADMQAAIAKHELVPLHVPCNAAKAARVRQRFAGLNGKARLSCILANDPNARFMGFVPGMVIMVRETWGRDQGGVTYFEIMDVLS